MNNFKLFSFSLLMWMQKICPFCKKKACFFYFAHLFLQNFHISFSIIHIYSIKYSFFPTIISLRDPHTTHTATIIQPPNHHHQATQQPSHHPIKPSYHQWNSHNHSIKPPSTSLQKPKSKDPSSTHTITIINLPKSKDPKTH